MIDGIFNVYKEAGMTSHDVVSIMRKILNTHKIGHGGTLDPMATGVLPVFVGRATRFLEYALFENKAYRATLVFGKKTTTGDAEGEVVSTSAVRMLNHGELERIIQGFRGKGLQIPPMYSAIKYQGKKLYQYARQGLQVERAAREIEIYSLKIVAYDGATLVFDVNCSKGTYIRQLGEDIALACGMQGFLSALCRTRVGSYSLSEAFTLEQLRQNYQAALLPLEKAIEHLPSLQVNSLQGRRIGQGVPTTVPGIIDNTEYVIYTSEGLCVGLAVAHEGRLQAKKIINIPEGTGRTDNEDDNHS